MWSKINLINDSFPICFIALGTFTKPTFANGKQKKSFSVLLYSRTEAFSLQKNYNLHNAAILRGFPVRV